MNVTILLNAIITGANSAKRAANVSKNPIIKDCHEQEYRQLTALIANIPKYEKEWQALLEKTLK